MGKWWGRWAAALSSGVGSASVAAPGRGAITRGAAATGLLTGIAARGVAEGGVGLAGGLGAGLLQPVARPSSTMKTAAHNRRVVAMAVLI